MCMGYEATLLSLSVFVYFAVSIRGWLGSPILVFPKYGHRGLWDARNGTESSHSSL